MAQGELCLAAIQATASHRVFQIGGQKDQAVNHWQSEK
jgi:hypothetical protein